MTVLRSISPSNYGFNFLYGILKDFLYNKFSVLVSRDKIISILRARYNLCAFLWDIHE